MATLGRVEDRLRVLEQKIEVLIGKVDQLAGVGSVRIPLQWLAEESIHSDSIPVEESSSPQTPTCTGVGASEISG